MSNEIARGAGLERGIEPVDTSIDVVFPTAQYMNKLKKSVSFTKSELTNLLTENGIIFEAIENLILELGNVSINNYNIDNGELLAKPIVKISGKFIVAVPGILLTATRNELIRLAIEHGVKNELVKFYSNAVWNNIKDSLGYINNYPTKISTPDIPEIPFFQDAFFQFDTDKLAYVSLVSDPLDSYDSKQPFAYCHLNDIDRKLEPRIKEIYKYIFNNFSDINEVLFLLIFQGVGRLTSIKQQKIESLLLIHFSAGDLETITLLEGGKPLVLWKYAISISRLKQQANFVSFNELNNLFHYRENDYSYYLSDQSIVNKDIFIQDGAGELRQEVIRQRDYHAVPSYIPNCFTEVTLLFNTREFPIYIPRSFLSKIPQPLACLLEALPLYVWIIQKNQEEVNNLYREFLVAIAYWLWQFNPSLNPIIQSLISKYRVIIIQLSLPSNKTWFEPNKRQNFSEDITPINIEVDTNSGTINVTILPEASRNFLQVDNSAEREMMKYILTGFRELLPEQEQENLSDEIISKIIEIYAPLGLKKQIIYLDSSINPELDPQKLPAYQKVQKADINELLDDLGDYLNSVNKYPQGKIPENERTKFLRDEVVGFFYSELKKLVALLNPENLLEYLISYHEAIVRQVNEHRLTIPTRLACFNSIPERYENIQKEMLENNQAALASRFIIEYVVGQPPTGIRPFSLSIYHRLQALAYQIINIGFQSDLIHFSLADFQLSILPSGRLGTDTKEYEQARETHLSIFMSGETTRITESFERYWETPQIPTEKPEIVKKIDAAASIEFGYSITEICELLGEAIDIGKRIHPTVICLPLENFITRLATQLNWNEEKVTKAIELLSLSQRYDFLKPNKPFQGRDIFPWKFNRLLSYLRRPFLLGQKNNKIEIIWGIRHLYEVKKYLIQLCLTGKLQAKSKEMKKVISQITIQTGKDFNNKIADWFEQDSTLIVHRKVEKIGETKIEKEKGKPLGDIDVLVADPGNLSIKIIECKNFSMARAPHQMKNELDNLFIGKGKGKTRKKPAIEHHQERVKWVRDCL